MYFYFVFCRSHICGVIVHILYLVFYRLLVYLYCLHFYCYIVYVFTFFLFCLLFFFFFLMIRRPPRSTRTDTLFPFTTLFRSLSGCIRGMVQSTRDLIVLSVTPKGATGKVFAFVYNGSTIGGMIMPLVFGWVLDNGLPEGVFWVAGARSEEHTSELQSLMRISYAVFCLKKKRK